MTHETARAGIGDRFSEKLFGAMALAGAFIALDFVRTREVEQLILGGGFLTLGLLGRLDAGAAIEVSQEVTQELEHLASEDEQ